MEDDRFVISYSSIVESDINVKASEGAVELGRDQHGKLVGRLRGKARRREADAGAGRRERIEIFRIVEKRDVGRARDQAARYRGCAGRAAYPAAAWRR